MERDNDPRKDINVRGAAPRRLNSVKGRLTRKWGAGWHGAGPRAGKGTRRDRRATQVLRSQAARAQWVWAQPEPLLGARGLHVTVRVMEGLAAPRRVCECYTEKVAGSEQGDCML